MAPNDPGVGPSFAPTSKPSISSSETLTTAERLEKKMGC